MTHLTLHLEGGATELRSLLVRADHMDPQALVRFRPLDVGETAAAASSAAPATPSGRMDAFVSTPFEVLASRRVTGSISEPGSIRIADALAGGGPDVSSLWAGALPPAQGFQLLDTIPVQVVRELADQGQALARQFSGPLGPPKNLLEQTVLTVSDGTTTVEIPMRLVFCCTALGFIPSATTTAAVPRFLRVSGLGRWIRVDAAYGTVYMSRGLPLLF